MMKKLAKVLFTIIISFVFVNNVFAVSQNTSLKDLKDKLAKQASEVTKIAKKQQETQKAIKELQSELGDLEEDIDEAQEGIEESKAKIKELESDIKVKQSQIDNLLNFKQLSNGENVYLEYIFQAKTFSDFIYRASVVEQLTKYNDGLIDEMNQLIKDNQKEQKVLSKKITTSEETMEKVTATLKKHNLTLDDLADDHKDAKADYEASKKEVAAYEKLYKKYNCAETKAIIECVSIPYADGFVRPTVKGSITSNFGLRYHPTLHYYRMHNGVDIGVGMGTKVYAAAAGIVSKITKVKNPNKKNSSCGGNAVYIKHRINSTEYTTVYMHLHTIKVSLNDYVTNTTVIGTSGGGESYDYCTTGPHLHFGVMKGSTYVNPKNYVKLPSRWTSRW